MGDAAAAELPVRNPHVEDEDDAEPADDASALPRRPAAWCTPDVAAGADDAADDEAEEEENKPKIDGTEKEKLEDPPIDRGADAPEPSESCPSSAPSSLAAPLLRDDVPNFLAAFFSFFFSFFRSFSLLGTATAADASSVCARIRRVAAVVAAADPLCLPSRRDEAAAAAPAAPGPSSADAGAATSIIDCDRFRECPPAFAPATAGALADPSLPVPPLLLRTHGGDSQQQRWRV